MIKYMFKHLSVIVLVLVTSLSACFVYAYWDQQSQNTNTEITLGEGVSLNVRAGVTVPEGKFLVPSTADLKANDITEVVLTYIVKLDQQLNEEVDLSVTASVIRIGGSLKYNELVNVDISPSTSKLNNENVLITITVTLREPIIEDGGYTAIEAKEAYAAIKLQEITLTLFFLATAVS